MDTNIHTNKEVAKFANAFDKLIKKHGVSVSFSLENEARTVPFMCKLAFRLLNYYGFTVKMRVNPNKK